MIRQNRLCNDYCCARDLAKCVDFQAPVGLGHAQDSCLSVERLEFT